MPTVFIPAQLRSLTGGRDQFCVEGGTVREVVESLEAQFPGIKSRLCRGDGLAPTLQVSIDGVMSTQGLRAKVGPDSEVHFLPAIGGGC
jgi:molybdopterin synthase sulfur carrier subunit